jgi:hypothetical protein
MKRVISIVLTIAIVTGLFPAASLTAEAESDGVTSITNKYITLNVSEKNGGFYVNTDKGDKLNKSDDNKELLYHSGEYDTSFTSFEVTYKDGSTKDYLFGGSYGFLGMSSSAVSVSKVSDSEIDAVWKLNELTFTQKLTLVNSGANEHGMVSINYDVKNNGSSAVKVKARVLLDTALGGQDYGCYQVIDENDTYRSIKTETVLTASDSIPQNFYAYDDPYNPSITAYTVSKQGQIPYQAAFGHWNNLAATLFAFKPDNKLDFTDSNNKYLTTDSAYALYYDLGSVSASGGNSSFLTYYGVYSHQEVASESTMTVDVTAPTSLTLNDANTAYIPQVNKGIADFSVQAGIKNLMNSTAKGYSNVTLAIYSASGLMPLNAKGEAVPGLTYEDTDPYTMSYADVNTGSTVTDTLYFSAKPAKNAEYRKVKLQVYDTSKNATLTTDKLLGEKIFYILCPGTNGDLPKFTFTSLTPDIIYCSGTRHLFLTGTNIDILYTSIQSGNCTLKAYSKDFSGQDITVLKENVLQPGADKLDIILPDDMVTGDWYLKLEWSDNAVQSGIVTSEYQKQTAPALNFTVSDDKKYKNDTYGVIAVVQTASGARPAYRIMSFLNESAYDAFKKGTKQADDSYDKSYVEILLELRGQFEVKSTTYDAATSSYVPTVVKATSLKASVDDKATNCISINNCMDFEDGVLTVKYDSVAGSFGNIQVSFDGALYTSNARTSIWKGEAAFTQIDQGTEYGLISYDENGNRAGNFKATPISLVWPSVYGAAQTIAGMVFNLAYGQLGVMEDGSGNEVGRLISFTANLDLGFLIPSGTSKEPENTYWTRLKNYWKFYKEGKGGMYSYWAVENVDSIVDFSNETGNDNNGAASIMVKDILFGCGTGFVGVHFIANVAIPNYVDGMPRIEGTLEVNTIGNWSFAVEGKMEMPTFTLEVSLALKSYKNIPVPDKIYFFVSGFEPGINVDAHGIVWITGGGGGIDNIYDTIFLTNGVPPLKILISVSFDLLKVLSARADFSISLTGLSFSASDVKVKATNIVAVKKAAAQFDWYPNLYLMGSIKMSLFDIIKGSGYIVLEGQDYSKWFFEAFVRAGVYIPDSMPFVGGMTVGQVDLGVNAEKIWGQLKVLFVSLGVNYYWGDSINFGAGESASPSYPDLLGCKDIPVYYDKDKDRTLYMRVGTNLSVAAQAEITDDLSAMPRLMDTSSSLYSSGDKLKHKLNLGTQSVSGDALITLNYSAKSVDDAKNIAKTIIANGVKDKNGVPYDITLYNGTNIDAANANVTYDSKTGKGSLTFTMTSSSCYDKDWNITTPVAADIILYNVASVPEITSVSGSINNSALDINWTGTKLAQLDSVKYYLVSDKNNVENSGYPLGELTDSNAISSGKTSYEIPSNVPTGEYYIRAVYSKDGAVNSIVNSVGSVSVVNTRTPDATSISAVSPAGDLKLDVKIDNPIADAYVVNVYKYDAGSGSWIYSDVNGMVVDKADLVNNTLTVGGSYTFADDSKNNSARGLSPDVDYRIGVTACNYLDSDSDGKKDSAVLSKENFYSSAGSVTNISSATSVRLPKPVPTTVTVKADKLPVSVARMVGDKTESFDTYSSSDLTLTASADRSMTGTWTLDGDKGASGTINGKTALIKLTGLADGDHTLIVKGTGPNGDGFRQTYSFTVDTLGPRLILNSPANGSFFNENGTLEVSGVTDANARFSVSCDGMTACENKSISELGGSINNDGVFSFKVSLPNANSASSHKLVITASDAVGNTASAKAEVAHGGLSDIKSIDVYVDGVKLSNNNVTADMLSAKTCKLSLCAKTKAGISFFLTDEKLVSWSSSNTDGTSSVSDDGMLTIGADSAGYVTGSLRVASTGSRTSSITFGAERYSSSSNYSVVTGSTIGGSVTGGGMYAPNDTVKLTATPDSGYYFTGWTLEGMSIKDTSASTITFNMPKGNVMATAHFAAKVSGGFVSSQTGNITYSFSYTAGQKVTCKIPAGADANCYVPYYFAAGKKVYVTMSANENGLLTFIAPVDGKYSMEERKFSFSDIEGHWAKDYIKSAAARSLFSGIGNNKFDPNGAMTRGMLVTVLWKLAGSPSGSTSTFKDVAKESYYSQALAWASNSGIVSGYGNGLFGAEDKLTREQMCVIFSKYLSFTGQDTSKIADALSFSDKNNISLWAAQSVNICRGLGIVNGKSGNVFDPTANTTRAECSTMLINLIKICLKNIK